MAFVAFLNELSFPEGQLITDKEALAAVVGLVRTLQALKKIHPDTALHSSVPIAAIPLGDGIWLGQLMSSGEARDDWRYIRSVQNRSPFTVEVGTVFGTDIEYIYCGKTAEGLGFSHALGTLALSFPFEGWLQSSLEVERLHLDEASQVDQEIVVVMHAAEPQHITASDEWIRSALLTRVNDGADLWRSRADVFPHLKFLPRVESQLQVLKSADILFRSTSSALMELELAVAAWNTSDTKFPPFRTKVTPEGETRSRKCIFKDLAGVDRNFNLHSRYTPGAGRVHFWCDRTDGTATIGHVGQKLTD